ncbi:ATP synthase, subunit E [Eubacterium nodatum ATCC 33099]|nr:ATP synthase, subunit E [Eubacterium nodatum ATCC 33099]
MGVEKITSRILFEAENIAENTISEAEKKCETILEEAKARGKEIVEAAEKDSKTEKKNILERGTSVADIDGRKLVLEQKQKYIKTCFDKAVEKIVSMDEDKYIKFLVDTVKDGNCRSGEVILNEKDLNSIGENLVKRLNEEIGNGDFKLSGNISKIKGGLLIKSGSVYMNGSVETVIDEKYSDLAAEVAAILFDD